MFLTHARHAHFTAAILLCAAHTEAPSQAAFNDFEDPPHNYWETPPQDAATHLHERIQAGEVKLPAGDAKEFVTAYLNALGVPAESQIIVFSQTSFQRKIIRAENPRAMFFNEDVYVGWIPGGKIEVAAIDPVLGAIFYIFDPPTAAQPAPKLERLGSCLGCHAGSATNFLPALTVNSRYTMRDGRPLRSARPSFSGHGAEIGQRWGGWFVTGESEGLAHLGNAFASGRGTEVIPAGDLGEFIDPDLLPFGNQSDIAAMLLHDHQVGAINRLIEANYRIRTALYNVESDLPVAERPLSGTDLEMAREHGDRLLEYLFFAGEAPLPESGIAAEPQFARAFAANRKPDARDRSLKDLRLRGRMLEYRFSYMIYSEAFRGLPKAFRDLLYHRIREIGTAAIPAEGFRHIPAAERKAIVEILDATLPEFAAANQPSAG
ncbi:MAG: hypothetical protein R3F11_23645 [Verrucomicrobiales bacterium]